MADEPDAEDAYAAERRAFGAAVRRLRASAQMSQVDLARETGLHVTYLSGIERGLRNPSLTNIVRIASALGVEPAVLFVESDR